MNGLDLNAIAQSAFDAINEILNAATQLVGIDCLWARATPVDNAEDIILLEYTLTQVGLELPKVISVITLNNDYNPGNMTIDLFGTSYEQPLEINISLDTWNSIFGYDTMPLTGDIVYIKIYHKLFEVKSSTQIYSVGAKPMYYKCQLGKYNPSVTRRETDEMKQSIGEITVSQEILFGDLISQEVADNNNTVETGYNNTTFVDPQKDFDIDCINSESEIYGADHNLIANAYYDWVKATRNTVYHTDMIYETSADRNHIIYSCWINNISADAESGKVTALTYFSKDKSYWNFIINSTLKLNVGDVVTVTRGSVLKITGTIVTLPCENSMGVQFKQSDMTKANKKITKWYEQVSALKIYKNTMTYNLISGYDESDKNIFDITLTESQINFNINGMYKSGKVSLKTDMWHYIMVDISPDNIRYVINDAVQLANGSYIDKVVYDNNIHVDISNFNIRYFAINNAGINLHMCNIRLYENEFEMGDAYQLDMYSPITRNASKLILVDSPNVPNKSMFISPLK